MICNAQVQSFLDLCERINFPVSLDKTFWGTTRLTFLGLLIDTIAQMLAIPEDKILKGKVLIDEIIHKKKVTVHKLQSLCGFLNFLGRSVVPGRTFTRRIYAAYSLKNCVLKSHHHVRVTAEVRLDLQMWLKFLQHSSVFSRKFIDFQAISAEELAFFTDASGKIGLGAFYDGAWMYGRWDKVFIETEKPSIEFLELFAVTAGILAWVHKLKNKRIILFCDNQSAVEMINKSTSSCVQCMKLIRVIVLQGLIHNVKINARHVMGKNNEMADFLSRDKVANFRNIVQEKGFVLDKYPTPIPNEIWPVQKLWFTKM